MKHCQIAKGVCIDLDKVVLVCCNSSDTKISVTYVAGNETMVWNCDFAENRDILAKLLIDKLTKKWWEFWK